jgi:excisionase family DNA binding protein
MQKKKDVLTTGQVAQICNVAPRTVTKWFDSGQLKGYRIPGSKDRRIPTSELIRFMKAHEMPTDQLDIGCLRVLIIDSDKSGGSQLCSVLAGRDYDAELAENNFDAGVIAHKLLPHVILINLMANDINAEQVCKYVRSSEELSTAKLVALAAGLGDNEISALVQKGYDDVVTEPGKIEEIVKVIEQTTSMIY